MRLNQTDIVTELMKVTKKLAQQLNFFGIMINQVTREGTEKALQGKESTVTISANASEFERSSDVMLVVGETAADSGSGKMFVDNPKARDSVTAPRIILKANKGCCEFKQADIQDIPDEKVD
jgi:hypothetical protein